MPILGSRGISPRGYGFAGAGKPNAPVSVSATDVGTSRAYNNGAATVSFSSGGDNGAPITSYTVTSSPGGFTATGSSSPLTVTGLQSATSYTFTVTATNSVGTSDASSASSAITATTVPQAPTIGSATAGNASATVAYTAGATGGKAVSTFTATSSPGSLTGTGSSPITVSGLTNGTAYTFTVTATNDNGTSSASSASNSVTPISTNYIFHSLDTAISSTGTSTGKDTTNNRTINASLAFSTLRVVPATLQGTVQTGVRIESGYNPFGPRCVIVSNNKVIVSGYNPSNNARINLAQVNANMGVDWQRYFQSSQANIYASHNFMDSSGNVYVVGSNQSSSTPGTYNGFIIQYNSSGTYQWYRNLPSDAFDGYGRSGCFNGTHIVVMGTWKNVSDSVTTVISKLSTSGTNVTSQQITSGTNLYSLTPVGTTVYANSGHLLFSLNTSSAITINWQRRNTNTMDNVVGVDADGNVYTSARSTTNSEGLEIFKFNSAGTLQWQRRLRTQAGDTLDPSSIGITTADQIAVNFVLSGEGQFRQIVLNPNGSGTGTYVLGARTFIYDTPSRTITTGTDLSIAADGSGRTWASTSQLNETGTTTLTTGTFTGADSKVSI